MKVNSSLISKYRTQLMGIGTLMIIACHATGNGISFPQKIISFLSYGNWGVDIFLFLSGLGLYCSLNKGGSTISFYYKRFIRVFIPYWIITIPFAIFYLFTGRDNLCTFLQYITTMGFWLHHKGAWFVSLLVPLYLITPVLFKVARIGGVIRNMAVILLIGLCITLHFSSITQLGKEYILYNVEFTYWRIPSFLLGMFSAPHLNKETSNKIIYFYVFCFFSYLAALKVMHVSIPWLITPPLVLFLAFLCQYIEKIGKAFCALTMAGSVSLESYLYNIYFNGLSRFIEPDYLHSPIFNYGIPYIGIIVIGLSMAYFTNTIIKKRIIPIITL